MTEIKEKEFRFAVRPSETVFGEVHLQTDGPRPLKGEFYTDHYRIVPEKCAFAGRR